jgi:cell division protein FtsL
MSEKTELLEEYDSLVNPKGVDGTYFLYTILVIVLVSVVLFPKIYIKQQIYYNSRDISKLKGEYDTLKEENKLISSSVESIRFKNQILDTIF